jgi:hypothetical protein
MANDRVSAGIKILGVYFLVFGFEKLVGLVSALVVLSGKSNRMPSYLGAPSDSLLFVAAKHQAIDYLIYSAFFFVAALVCIKFTPMLSRLCGARDIAPAAKASE